MRLICWIGRRRGGGGAFGMSQIFCEKCSQICRSSRLFFLTTPGAKELFIYIVLLYVTKRLHFAEQSLHFESDFLLL